MIITETRPQAKTAGPPEVGERVLPRRCKLKSSQQKKKRVVISGLRPLWPSALENGSFFLDQQQRCKLRLCSMTCLTWTYKISSRLDWDCWMMSQIVSLLAINPPPLRARLRSKSDNSSLQLIAIFAFWQPIFGVYSVTYLISSVDDSIRIRWS